MGWLPEINLGLCAFLALAAWLVARRDRTHRAVALFLTWMAAGDWLRRLLLHARQGALKPYTGTARIIFHVDQAVVLSWSALFVAICIHYFAQRRSWPAFLGWAVAMALCLDYPAVSKDKLTLLYRVVALAALLASWGCIAWGIVRRQGLQPRLAHLTLILYATTDVGVYLVPYTRGIIANWPLVRLANFLLLSSCCAVHAWWLFRRPEAAETTSA